MLFVAGLLAIAGMRPAASTPPPNPGFETGDLSFWRPFCLDEGGGCANWSVTVGPAYARTGQFGARIFNAMQPQWSHAQLISQWFTDSSETYTIPIKLVGGATKFHSGVFVSIYDSTGEAVRYRGNTMASVECWPLGDPTGCVVYRLIPGEWVEYTFDFRGDFLRRYGRLPTSTRAILVSALQVEDFTELYVDDILVPAPQFSPVTVASLTLSRDTIFSCETVSGEVTLTDPAPAGGAVVTFSTTNQGVRVPAPIRIPEGGTRADFTIAANSPLIPWEGTITATSGRGSQRALLAVRPNSSKTLTLGAERVVGSGTVTATVALGCPAGPEPVIVPLTSSSSSVAAVPERVTIRPGYSTASFTVQTSPVASLTDVLITASPGSGAASATLKVLAPEVVSVTLAPGSLIGGATTSGTVTLSGPAPTGGAPVALSSDSSAASVPASVTVATGATTASFEVTTKHVLSAIGATVTASYGGVTRNSTLTLLPLELTALTLQPVSVLGGGTATATLKLNGVAPSGGALVSLSSDNPALVEVPASVVVAAGETSATFPVMAGAVSAATPVLISASYAGTLRSATLTVSPVSLMLFMLSRMLIPGGTPLAGTLLLSDAAPAGGIVITLTSSNPSAVAVPATVTVSEGVRAMFVLVTTSPVATDTDVVLTAEAGGATLSVTLRLRPPVAP
jgi:hypothetical protein